MVRKRFSIATRALLVALFVLTLLPVSVFAQRRWVVVRPSRSRVVIYQPRPRVIYQQRPYYSYPQSYYTNGYSSYGYSEPYYTNQYYSYQYSQPYFANRYTYSWANPTYSYDYREYRPRYRRSRVRVGIWLR